MIVKQLCALSRLLPVKQNAFIALSDQRSTLTSKKITSKRHGLEKEDYYTDANGFVVFTAAYHLKRGYCCKNGCLHCPYGFKKGER